MRKKRPAVGTKTNPASCLPSNPYARVKIARMGHMMPLYRVRWSAHAKTAYTTSPMPFGQRRGDVTAMSA